MNTLLGAERFYNAGFTGTNAVMANIEAGYIWNGHETLAHVQLIPTSSGAAGASRSARDRRRHGDGRPAGWGNAGPYQQGMAPDAQLFSGAIATSWCRNLRRCRRVSRRSSSLNFFGNLDVRAVSGRLY